MRTVARAGAEASAEPVPPGPDRSLVHLRDRLAILEARVRAAVERRRRTDRHPDDRFRGLYVSDADVDGLLASGGRSAEVTSLVPGIRSGAGTPATPGSDAGGVDDPAAPHGAADTRLTRLARLFGLDSLDVELLLVALAPDLDPRFERLYAYLQDDVTRKRPTAGLALELCGWSTWSMAARGRLLAGGPLVETGLVRLDDADRPFLARPLRVADRVVSYLLGGDEPDASIRGLVRRPRLSDPDAGRELANALRQGVGLLYLRDRIGSAAMAAVAGAFERVGLPLLVLDLGRLGDPDDPLAVAATAVREARLEGGGLLAAPLDQLASAPRAITALADAACPVVLVGRGPWQPEWSERVPLVLDAPVPGTSDRARLWAAVLSDQATGDRAPVPGPATGDRASAPDGAAADGEGSSSALADAIGQVLGFRLAPEQVMHAARSASIRALAQGRAVGAADLQAGARSENATGLDRLARRIEPRAGWHDLVLPAPIRTQLRELASRARHRDRVLGEWRLGGGATRGRGVTALFSGDPGTGKTLSAEVVAADLGLDLYVIDLSTVVDKYIGETEKNLDRIFSEADRINGVLLFDEADALFGRRSEVRDARDRYANVEIAYLLQRMEHFDGLAILTTNLRANLDEAFTRRLDVLLDFPLPEEDDRLALWRMHLPDRLPLAEDLDLRFMAARFRLSGGHIRNICVTAAFLAAARGGAVTMTDIVRATEREYGKLGRLRVEDEFGPYLSLLGAGDHA